MATAPEIAKKDDFFYPAVSIAARLNIDAIEYAELPSNILIFQTICTNRSDTLSKLSQNTHSSSFFFFTRTLQTAPAPHSTDDNFNGSLIPSSKFSRP